jgi:RNA recognition motif-containing protein
VVKEKLTEIKNAGGEERLKRCVVVLELPFIIDEKEVEKYFSKCAGYFYFYN